MRSPAIALSILAAALSAGAMAPKADTSGSSAMLSRDAPNLALNSRAPVQGLHKRQDDTTDPATDADPAADDTTAVDDVVPAVEADPATTDAVENTTDLLDAAAAPAGADAADTTADTPAVLSAAAPASQASAAPLMKARESRSSRVRGRGSA